MIENFIEPSCYMGAEVAEAATFGMATVRLLAVGVDCGKHTDDVGRSIPGFFVFE
jgi:hypothetical protein